MTTADPLTRILFVDDDEFVCRYATFALQASNRLVVTCGSGAEAVAKARATRPDLIVTDLFLPDGIGPAILADQIADVVAEVPVLVISGCPPEDAVREGHIAETTPFLRKPFKIWDLKAAVHEMLALHTATC